MAAGWTMENMFIFPLHLRNILAAKDEKNSAMNFGYSLWASSLASLNYATMQKQIFLFSYVMCY